MILSVKQCVAVAVTLLLIQSVANGQNHDYTEAWRWTRFTTESGLPSDDVRQVTVDRDGTLWVTTRNGLAWYDGFRWIAVGSTMLTYQGMMGQNLLLTDALNRTTHLASKEGIIQLPPSDISSSAPFTDTSFVFSTRTSLQIFNNERVRDFSLPHEVPFISAPLVYKNDLRSLWLKTANAIYKWKNSSWQPVLISTSHEVSFTAASISQPIAENPRGTGLIAILSPVDIRGLWEWFNNGAPKHIKEKHPDIIKAMAIGPNDEAVLAYRTDDVRIRQNGVWEDISLRHLGIKEINYINFDSTGNLYVATGNGLFRYEASDSRWKTWRHASPDARNGVNEILRTKDGTIWVATGDGLEVRKPDGTHSDIISIGDTRLDIVTGLAEDELGNVWVSSGSAASSFTGTFRWDGSRWMHFPITNDSDGVFIHKIRKDRKGRLWFLGLGKQYLTKEEDQPGAFVYENGLFNRWSTNNGLLSGRVYAFAEDRNGAYWFGTRGGLSRYQHGSWKYWTTANGIKGDRVFALSIDSTNRLWFTDFQLNTGIGFIDEDDSVRYATTIDGLVHNHVWDIQTAPDRRVWVTTSGGVSLNDNGNWFSIDEKSGLPLSLVWPVLPLENDIYLGTQGKGVAILNRRVPFSLSPKIMVEQPSVDEHSAVLRWTALSHWGEVEPKNILTRYQIDGDRWSTWSKQHEVILKNIASGTYTVRIQAKGSFGQFDAHGAQASFIIPPPLYLQPSFYVPVGTGALTIITLLLFMHFRKVRHRKDIQSSEAKFRSLTELTSSAIMVIADDHSILFANKGAEKLFACEPKELLTTKFDQLIHPDYRNIFVGDGLQHIQDDNTTLRKELQVVRKNDQTRWIDLTYGKVQFQNLDAMLVTAFDITERKKAEQAVLESERNFRIITEMISDYAYLDRIEEDGRWTVLWVTDSFYRLTGYSVEESQAPDFIVRFIHPDDLPGNIALMQQLLSGVPTNHDGRIITRDGKTLWLHHEARPVWNKDHTRIEYVYGAARDITQRKLDEERTRNLSKELTRAEERERRRMASFLHDTVGQTLSIAKMKLESIMKSHPDQSLQNLHTLLCESLQKTRSFTFELSPLILYDLGLIPAIDWLLEELQKRQSIKTTLRNGITELCLDAETRNILFEGTREALMNIVKHAEAKNVEVHVTKTDSSVVIVIRDDGIGFECNKTEEGRHQQKSFGLYNLSNRLKDVRGLLKIESCPGKGTTVSLQAPLCSETQKTNSQ